MRGFRRLQFAVLAWATSGAAQDPGACLIREDRILSGGVARDGIPSLTTPELWSVDQAEEFLDPWDQVLGVVVNGEPRAYPFEVLWWHEIINDTLGGKPIVVSYCPLTGSGIVFDPHVLGDGMHPANFGVSGLLFDNNLIMFDRTSETLWLQMQERGVCGTHKGKELELLPVVEMKWEAWRALYPETAVVSFNTGHQRAYGRYPYADYDLPDNQEILFPQDWVDRRLPIKEVVLGLIEGGVARAYSPSVLGELSPRLVVNDELEGRFVLVVFDQFLRMMLPFERTLGGGRTLSFELANPDDDTSFPFLLRDIETGSLWNLKGEALEGPLVGARLRPTATYAAMWFAWSNFYKFSEIYAWE